jgi:hypothetical protein
MKKLLYFILLLGCRWSYAQNIQKVEYFIDNDPGFGSGINIPITAGTNITANFTVPLSSGLSSGFHKFFVRAKDATGKWSVVHQQNFFKTNELPSVQNIVKLEYFIDTDPGFEQAIDIPILANNSITQGLNIPFPLNLPIGFHKFYIRAKDASGKWSMVHNQNFFKISELPSIQNIVKLEYFIDSDPGFNQGIDIPISVGTNITQGLTIPLLANLPLGFHKFFIRAKDESGKWSVVHQQNFFKTNELLSVQNIVKLEYFLGSDPGYGQGISIPVIANTLVDLSNTLLAVPINAPFGINSLSLRAQDILGKWSTVAIDTFTNCPGVTINAPNGLISCSTPIELNAQLQAPELGGSLQWFRNGVLLPSEIGTTILAPAIGLYQVKRSTAECIDFASIPLQVNILEGTQISLMSDKTSLFCNENFTIKIDTANSSLPIGIPVQFDWFRDNNSILLNSNQSSRTDTQAGTYKLRMKTSLIPNECQSFDSDVITIENQNLVMSLGPTTSENTLIICNGTVATLQTNKNLDQAITYKWFKNSTLIANQTLPNLILNNEPGVYQVRGSIGGCVDIPSNNLTVSYTGNSSEVATISSVQNLNQTFCGGDTLQLSATGCSSGVLWSFGATESSVSYIVGGSTTLTASCQGGCLGNASNVLVVNSSGFKGSPSVIQYATYPFQPNYHTLQNIDYLNTYNGMKVMGLKPLFGGGNLTFGTYDFTFENISNTQTAKGDKDYFIRFNHGIGGYGTNYLFGGSGMEILQGYYETNPNQYLLFGQSNSPISGDVSQASFGGDDFWILKYNFQSQSKVFDKKFGGTAFEKLADVTSLNNGQLLIAGTSNSAVSGNKSAANFGSNDYWVVKTDAAGNKLADYSFGGTGNDELRSILKINDNEFVLFGISNSGISGNKTISNLNSSYDYWAVWINANGQILRQKVYGGSQDEGAVKALLSSTGEIYFAGNSSSGVSGDKTGFNRGQSDYWVVKTDVEGNKIWDKTLGGNLSEILTTATFTLEGNLAMIGNTNTITPNNERISPGFDSPNNTQDVWLIEINPEGIVVTDYIIGSCRLDEASPVLLTDFQGRLRTYCNITRVGIEENCAIKYTQIAGLLQRYPIGFILEKAVFKNDNKYFCKNTELFFRANTPNYFTQFGGSVNQPISYSSEFQWSNGQTGTFFKTVLTDTSDIHFSYKILGQNCYSLWGSSDSKIYPDVQTLTGSEVSEVHGQSSKQFAYKRINSSRIIQNTAAYTSEGAMELRPGFLIQATEQKTFKAEIEGCINQ